MLHGAKTYWLYILMYIKMNHLFLQVKATARQIYGCICTSTKLKNCKLLVYSLKHKKQNLYINIL
jgi:hypothetical protein